MSQRTYALLLSLAGAGVVLALLLCGINLRRAAAAGPRWQRALVTAGMFLLTAIGLLGCNDGPPPMATCYEVAVMPPAAGATVAELRQQLDLLRQQTIAGDLTPDTAAVIIGELENKLALLRDTAAFTAIDTPARPAAFATRNAAQAALAGLRRDRLLLGDARWQKMQSSFNEARAIIGNRRGSYPFNQSEKDELTAKLQAVPGALDRLAADGLLPAAAAGLLTAEAQELLAGVQRFRPTEMQLATCYRPMAPPSPAAVSLQNLSQRQALLDQLAAEHDLAAALVRQVRESISDDLAILSDHSQLSQLAQLPDEQQDAARAAVRRAQDALARLAQ